MAGLAAARSLEERGAEVTVVEARDRVGGRVWTIRDCFRRHQFAEGGADLLEDGQDALKSLIQDLGLKMTPVLRDGFGYYGMNSRGRLAIQSLEGGFRELDPRLRPLIHAYRLAEGRSSSPIVRRLASQSVAAWLESIDAAPWLLERLRGFRGLFLADPEDLSMLALIEFLADIDEEGWGDQFRIKGGNDRLATETAGRLRGDLHLRTIVRRVRQTKKGVSASVERDGRLDTISADYVVIALPAPTLADVQFEPELPAPQRDAISSLRYGDATRLLLQFDRRFWARQGRPRAYGSDQAFGALWDGNEQQKGSGAGILSFLAGGGASHELRALLDASGIDGLLDRLRWLGPRRARANPPRLLASKTIVWEQDPFARGGYAVFDPDFDPQLRDWLARPAGRVVFAGEHTSVRWQGYVNGAIESGQRAAEEICASA
jgi:monoamine oxidase